MSRIQTKFIADNAVTNAKLDVIPAGTIKGNNTGSTGGVSDLTVAQVLSMLSVSNWATYTPVVTGFGTVSSASGSYKQVNDSLFLKLYFVAGTVDNTLATFSLPAGFTLSMSLSKIPVNNTNANPGISVGTYSARSNTSNNFGTWSGAILTAPASSNAVVYAGKSITDLTGLITPTAGQNICDTGSVFTLQCEVILA